MQAEQSCRLDQIEAGLEAREDARDRLHFKQDRVGEHPGLIRLGRFEEGCDALHERGEFPLKIEAV